MQQDEDLYEILQLHPSAQLEVIEAAYKRLALLYHPDTDPSPRAAEMMTVISRAYAVLGDPDKRVQYDLARKEQSDTPEAQAESDAPKPRARRRKGQSGADYVTIGSRKDDVSRIQGPPSETRPMDHMGFEGENWIYGTVDAVCVISFNKAGRVTGWMNRGDLKVRMVPGPNATISEFFSIGSYRDDVARLQGTPYSVASPDRLTRAEIKRRQQEEREHRELMLEIGKQDYEPFHISDDDDSDLETWRFSGGIVEFSVSTGRVTAFDNKDGSLKVRGVSPETEASKKIRRTATASAPESTPATPASRGNGYLLPVTGLLAVAAMAALLVGILMLR